MLRIARSAIAALAAAAVLAGAQAADAQTRRGPQPAPRADDHLRSCPEFGSGFYRLPGTSTCVQISGRVGAEMGFGSRGRAGWRSPDGLDTGASLRGGLDARTRTPAGDARAVVRFRGVTGTRAN